jgi:hypothetical protein
MRTRDISPHSIGSASGGGTSATRDTSLSAGGEVRRRVFDPVSGAAKPGPGTPAAANFGIDSEKAALKGTFGTDREGFAAPNPKFYTKEDSAGGAPRPAPKQR